MGKEIYDVLVIGGGPAGISSAIYARRAGASVLIFDNGTSALKRAKHIQNYFGIEMITGEELLQNGINQVKKLGAKVKKEEVLQIINDFDAHTYIVVTSKNNYRGKTVIICTGAGKKKMPTALLPFEGTNVSFCAICDGFFYRGKDVAVIGDGEFALHEAEELSKNAKRVYLVNKMRKKIEKISKNIILVPQNLVGAEGKGKVETLILENGDRLKIDGVFVAEGSLSGFEITKQLGIITNKDIIVVDKSYMTNLPGVFAAGDVVGGLLQVSKSVSDGAQAGIEAVRFIKVMEGDV